MHIPTRFIKRHAYQSQFSGSCGFSALYTNASFWRLRVKGLKGVARRFDPLKIFLEDNYYILAHASCGSGEYNKN